MSLGLHALLVFCYAIVFHCHFVSAQQPQSMPSPSLAELPAWLKENGLRNQRTCITLVGIYPQVLPVDVGFVELIQPSAPLGAPSENHTRLISWMRQVLPKTKIICIPDATDQNGNDLFAAVESAMSQQPAIVFFPASSTVAIESDEDSQRMGKLLALCWLKSCLPFTVRLLSDRRPSRLGVLPIYIDDFKEFDADGERWKRQRNHIIFPRGHAVSTPLAEDDALAAMGYFSVGAAILSEDGFPSHLERTARLALTGSAYRRQDLAEGHFQRLNLNAALHPEEMTFQFGTVQCKWDDTIQQGKGFGLLHELGGEENLQEKKRQIVVAIRGTAKLRWLSAAAILTDSVPLLLVPGEKQGIVVFQPRPFGWDAGADIELFRLLRTQQVQDDETRASSLFFAVSQEFDFQQK